MKKLTSIILVIALVAVLGISLVACSDDPPTVYEKAMTSAEAEDFLFGQNGALNFANKVFNVKAQFNEVDGDEKVSGEAIIVLDETNGENFATVYSNVTSVDGTEPQDNDTYFVFINWEDYKGGFRNGGVVHMYSEGTDEINVQVYDSGYETIHNEAVKNCGIHDGRKLLENYVHNANDDIYDTLNYAGKAVYNDEAMTSMARAEISISYYYYDNGVRVNGTVQIVFEMNTVKLADGSEERGMVMTSMSLNEDCGDSYEATYTYGVDTIEAPDMGLPHSTWPEAYPIA